MKKNDLVWLIKVFGAKAKVVDVINTLRLIAEIGDKMSKEGL